MTRFRCGNDPRTQLTPGDRATARTEEKTTVSDLDAAREALRGYSLRPGYVDAVERFEAAVRANERTPPMPMSKEQAELRAALAEAEERAETDDRVMDALNRKIRELSDQLRHRADEVQP